MIVVVVVARSQLFVVVGFLKVGKKSRGRGVFFCLCVLEEDEFLVAGGRTLGGVSAAAARKSSAAAAARS